MRGNVHVGAAIAEMAAAVDEEAEYDDADQKDADEKGERAVAAAGIVRHGNLLFKNARGDNGLCRARFRASLHTALGNSWRAACFNGKSATSRSSASSRWSCRSNTIRSTPCCRRQR